MERRVTPPWQVTSTTWGPPPPCKQTLPPNSNSPYCLPYHSYDASSKNLLLDQFK